MSEERDVIRGKLKQIVFRNDDNGYTVARFIVDDLQQRQVTITGYLPVFSEDALMELSGSYVDHPRYGMQFQVETFHRVMPDDEDSLIRFLSGSSDKKRPNCTGQRAENDEQAPDSDSGRVKRKRRRSGKSDPVLCRPWSGDAQRHEAGADLR